MDWLSDFQMTPLLGRSDELRHHGILGQKWGVRRFQNKDGSLTAAGRKRYNPNVLRAGRKIYRVTRDEDEDLSSRDYAYVSYKARDRDAYVGEHAQDIITNDLLDSGIIKSRDVEKTKLSTLVSEYRKTGNNVFLQTYKTVKDLAIPTYKQQSEVFSRIVDQTPHIWDNVRDAPIVKWYASRGLDVESIIHDDRWTRDKQKLVSAAFMDKKEIRDAIVPEMTKRGFDVIRDDNDVGWTQSPIIVINPSSVLDKFATQALSAKDIGEAFNRRVDRAIREGLSNQNVEYLDPIEWEDVAEEINPIGTVIVPADTERVN